MDRIIESNSVNHIININERKSITISGVKKIDSFDTEEFLLDSNLGPILLKGSNLEIIKLDTLEGHVSIKGEIDSLAYLDSEKSKGEASFLGKLFKWI